MPNTRAGMINFQISVDGQGHGQPLQLKKPRQEPLTDTPLTRPAPTRLRPATLPRTLDQLPIILASQVLFRGNCTACTGSERDSAISCRLGAASSMRYQRTMRRGRGSVFARSLRGSDTIRRNTIDSCSIWTDQQTRFQQAQLPTTREPDQHGRNQERERARERDAFKVRIKFNSTNQISFSHKSRPAK